MPGPPSLVPLTRPQLATAWQLVPPERPGPMIAQHLLGTGNGSCLADRWPGPRALAVETGGNWTLAGDPAALDPAAVAGRLAGLGPETRSWIAATWGGPGGLAASGTGWGAFQGRRLVAVACPFFVGAGYEDLGVATEPGFRGSG